MRKLIAATAAALVLPAAPALAAPGLGEEVYGATVESGELEAEARWDSLAGGPDDGEDALVLEAAYGVNDRLRLGIRSEFEKEPGLSREAEAMSLEAIYALGKAGGIDFAVYGEYEIAFNGADKIETKLLMQRRTGPWDLRLNLIGEKVLKGGNKVELSYAASADVEAMDEVRVGVEAFGDLGTFSRFMPHAEHFAGPYVSTEIEGLGPELELKAGYLFAIGKARDDTDGQVRLALEMEF